MPFSTDGMNSFGIGPPTISFCELEAGAALAAARCSIMTWPYWPWPPDWRMNLPSALHRLARWSRGTRPAGLPTLASTLNSRLQAVDDDLEVQLAHAGDDGLAGLLVGADAERRIFVRPASASACRASPDRPWCCGSMAIEMTGSGKIIVSSTIGCFVVAQRVAGARLAQTHGGVDVARLATP